MIGQISKTRPELYLAQIAKDRLVAQSVPLDTGLWKLERFDEFLRERRKLLAHAMNELIENGL